MKRPKLGVNVDHVATVRQARGERYPDPVHAAVLAESAGADQITVHLRQDRRHIQDRDVQVLRETVGTRLNLEMGATQEMVEIATEVQPDMVTLVPERREERTTEGGLDAVSRADELAPVVDTLQEAGCWVSLFIDPSAAQIRAASQSNAEIIELHTGDFCDASAAFHNRSDTQASRQAEYERLVEAATLADGYDLHVAAGHGLNLENIAPVAAIPEIEEFNIGHSIVSRSIFVGFKEAVREMKEAILESREHGFDQV